VRQAQHTIEFSTPGRGLYPLTLRVAEWVGRIKATQGLLTLFLQHTSASLLIQENADPAVLADLERFFSKLVKDGDSMFAHVEEGDDDMPAHVRAALTQTFLSIPVAEGKLALGTWQGLYLYEHRFKPHDRCVVLHYLGE